MEGTEEVFADLNSLRMVEMVVPRIVRVKNTGCGECVVSVGGGSVAWRTDEHRTIPELPR